MPVNDDRLEKMKKAFPEFKDLIKLYYESKFIVGYDDEAEMIDAVGGKQCDQVDSGRFRNMGKEEYPVPVLEFLKEENLFSEDTRLTANCTTILRFSLNPDQYIIVGKRKVCLCCG